MRRIAVLGAGPMGLAVAYQLARDGHKPVVYEADDRVGGMAASFDFDGLSIERFYHFQCTSDLDLFQIMDELGLKDKVHWVPTKMGYYYQGRLQPWGEPLALLKFAGLGLVAKIRYGLHAFMCVRRNDWRDLDKVEATSWIKRWVGAEAYEVLWRRLFDYKFYDQAYNLSAAWIWSRIRRIGRSRYNMFQEKLGYIENGSQTVLNAMRDDILARGGEIHLKRPVTKVLIDAGSVSGVAWDGGSEAYDTVISTIPLPYVPRTMPDLPADVLAKFQAQRNVAVACVIVKLRKRLTGNFWLNVNDPVMEIPGLVEYSNLHPLRDHIVYVPFYMPGEHPKFARPDGDFAAETKRYLKTINPALTDDDCIAIHVSRYRFAQPVCGPGFLDTLPPAKLPVSGLWVADTSYYYPEDRGFSESVKFGRDMARQAIA